MRFRTHVETAAMYRAARVRYRRLGEPHSLIVALCVWTWSTWYAPLRAALSKYDHIHRRDREMRWVAA